MKSTGFKGFVLRRIRVEREFTQKSCNPEVKLVITPPIQNHQTQKKKSLHPPFTNQYEPQTYDLNIALIFQSLIVESLALIDFISVQNTSRHESTDGRQQSRQKIYLTFHA